MSSYFDFKELTKIREGLEDLDRKSVVGIEMLAKTSATDLENYAKKHRVWTDRTGHARQRLKGWVERHKNMLRIYIGHGVEYGIYLELAHEKRFAILLPTIQARSKVVLKAFDNLFDRIWRR